MIFSESMRVFDEKSRVFTQIFKDVKKKFVLIRRFELENNEKI